MVGASIGFGVLTKSNVKFMDSLCTFLKEKEFATLQEIYDEYMNKPKTHHGGNGKDRYDDKGRWGSIRPTKNSLTQLLHNRLPFVTKEKYILHNVWKNRATETKCLWSLTDTWESDLENYKIKLNGNHNIKTMKKYYKRCGGRDL